MHTVTLEPYKLLDSFGKVRREIKIPVVQFDEETYLVPTWQNYQEVSFNLAQNLLEAKIKPQTMVTLANGGFVPAKFVQDRLKFEGKVMSVGIAGYGADNKPLLHPVVANSFSEQTEMKGDVLVVDDICDKGTAKKIIKAEIAKKNPEHIYFGFVFMRREPLEDEQAGLVIGEEWVLFPSDLTENEDNLRGMWAKRN